jgi:hypothetical protein
VFAIAIIAGCKKDEQKVNFLGGTAPVLTASVSGVIPLSYATAANTALTLSWTNPDYQLSTGVSSLDVTYLVEIDTAGANFTNPARQSITIGKDLSLTLTQSQLNDYLLNQLNLKHDVEHDIEIRVTSQLTASSVPLQSNVLSFKATPYAIPPKVNPPSSGQLFLVGSATAGGWNNPVPVPSQQFTQVNETEYTITIHLTGGQEYLFLPVNGDWSHKYAVKDKTVAGLNVGGDFGADLNDNFPGPAADGTYTIDVDFQRGKFTVTKQ